MPIEPESLYRQLGQLAADIPTDLSGPAPISAKTHTWLGRVAALIELGGNSYDRISFNSSCNHLEGLGQAHSAHEIVAILHRALARAELAAPAAAQGAFIPVGAAFDVFQTIGKVLGEAKKGVMIVDAYMDATVLTDFAPLAAEHVGVRLLSDSLYAKPTTLQPPTARWVQQYGASRPLTVRLTAPRLLHDRLIIVDDERVWSLTQSLKDFAARSPGSVLRVEGDVAEMKVHAYGRLWAGAQPL